MNIHKLKQAETHFLQKYPGGFAHPELVAIGKKHQGGKMQELAQAAFARARFKDPDAIVDDMVKLVSRSSLVSVFEKPRFRDFANALPVSARKHLADGLKHYLHGDTRKGFDAMLAVLATGQLAKWSVLTVLPNYFHPQREVFVKPTTAKGVVAYFELDGLLYSPYPDWAFYDVYRSAILTMQQAVDPSLAPSNVAFSGFLMMSLPASH